ncbi:ferrous iron transport protein B [Acetobacterium carbinolicum]|jgi:ferrous iron transport protein B|uniref:ferrous iron transport protein B n=1 Tax=Acetobacterium TaxID=33951 RepID=UPI000DBEB139|nr:ferrous iron transport protein B [Acetobacterium sp. KB-1]AWW26438.1 ferrous iron transport protein B [Acetobacterium sp. KB-1]
MKYKIALVGNPNSGKTTLFNCLTGSNLYVGNWPGVTVEKKEGDLRDTDKEITLVDLPGIYSLAPYSMDEIVSRNFLLEERPDLIINIIDASNIERNLYLSTQLMELNCPMVGALNMMDVVKKTGVEIDVGEMEKIFGYPFIEISAQKETGIDELIKLVEKTVGIKKLKDFPEIFPAEIRDLFNEFDSLIGSKYPDVLSDYPHLFRAIKLIEKDEEVLLKIHEKIDLLKDIDDIRKKIETVSHHDVDSAIADYRYRFITEGITRATKKTKDNAIQFQDKLDKVLMNRYAALPIFFFFMFVIYYVSITLVGEITIGGIEWFINDVLMVAVERGLGSLGAAGWIIALINDGIITGVGAVLTFIPQLVVLFVFISILEDSGYMARVAFIMDRIFRHFGLSGKSFIPMVVGLGCSVPGIMATRTLENERERKLTAVLTPFISCGAKMPIYVLMASVFFAQYQTVLVFSLYLVSLTVVFTSGFVLSKTWFKGADSGYLLEIPPLRLPKLKNTATQVWQRTKEFIVRAGTIIFAASVVLWFLQSFDLSFQMTQTPDESILAMFGKIIAPIFVPLGFGNWVASVALLTGVTAKEMIISTMSVLLSGQDGSFTVAISQVFTPVSAYSFVVFILLASPCMAAIATMKKELGNWRDFIFALVYQIGLAYGVAFVIYQVGSRIVG